MTRTLQPASGSGRPSRTAPWPVSARKRDSYENADRRVYAPALCIAAAVSGRPRLADHIGGLLPIEVLDLTFATASEVGRLIAEGCDWRHAHAIVAASPNVEWPEGLPVATASPEVYERLGIATIVLT